MLAVEEADRALQSNNPARAVELLRASPTATSSEARFLLASALHRLGRNQEALDALRLPREDDKKANAIAVLEADLLQELGDSQAAMLTAQAAATRCPTCPEVAESYGRHLFRAGRPHAALEELHRALELDDTAAGAWHALARVYQHLDDLDNAQFASEQAATLRPHHPAIQSLHAHLLARSGAVEEAARVLHNILQHYPSDPSLRHQLAELLDRPVSVTFLAWMALWMVLMGVSLLLGVALNPLVGGVCFLFLLVGMVVWGASFSEDSDSGRLEKAVPGVTALVEQINEEAQREERTRDNPWSPPEV